MIQLRHSLILSLFLLSGCAGQRSLNEGLALIDGGEIDAGLAKISEAHKLDPGNREYRLQYFRQRDLAVQRYLSMAETARLQGQWDGAEAMYRRILELDPDSARGKGGLLALRTDRRQRALIGEAEDQLKLGNTQLAHSKVREILSENANNREAQLLLRRIEERSLRAAAEANQLSAALRKPVTLEFRDTGVRQVFELISRSTGLNFVFDRDVRPDLRTTIFVRNTSVDEVLRFILVSNQLERKVLNENTVLVYPATQAKQRDYQDLVVRTFYLANADAKVTANMIKSLVKTKDLHIDEKLNMVVMRDTPDAVRMAERLVAAQDLAEPEVMLEVEVLEVGSNVLYELGVRFPDQVSYSVVGAAGTAGTLTLPEWQNRGSGLVRMTVSNPFLALNLRNQLGRTNLLANPRIRVKNKEKAKVHIGDKVPVITTTSTSTGFISESVNYLDVGLKLDVEPLIYLEDDVGIKIGLEVSNIVREIRSQSGTLTYQVGTRNAATSLRLRDGETQILAGLISDEDRKSANQVPGLGDLPVIGRLFGSHQDTRNKTEIVLLITPRVVRNLARPELRFEQFPAGTESAIGAAPLLLQNRDVTTSAAPSASVQTGGSAILPAQSLPTSSGSGFSVLLQAPPNVPPGQEFSLNVSLVTAGALKSGLLDFTFDPSQLRFVRAEPGAAISASPEIAFRANAPEALGRLALNFSTKSEIKAGGELARLVFRVADTAAGSPSIRLEALSLTDSTSRVVAAQLPPPVRLALTR